MKTKTILKTLAVALLMPAMLLTTACSNEDDLTNNTVNSQPVANKGYALPVTVNATRGGDATRATFDGSKLNFGTGDKLFVYGSATAAGSFAGELDYVPATGKFSGTIYTQSSYPGTPDALFTAASAGENLTATLLPNGYGANGSNSFLSIDNKNTTEAYDDRLTVSYSKAFVASETAKATGVEQLSWEQSINNYSSGFALSPGNAILNFTITGLEAGAKDVLLHIHHGFDYDVFGSVTPNAGVATFAIGVSGGANIKDMDNNLTVGTHNFTLPSTTTFAAGKIYNITRAVPAATSLSELKTAINGGTDCSSYIGWEVNSEGAIAKSGVSGTKIGYVAYVSTSDVDAGVSGSRILVIASADAGTNLQWGSKGTARGLEAVNNANDLKGYSNTNTLQGYGSEAHPAAYAAWNYSATIPSGGATPAHWFMPTMKQWKNMRDAKGGTYGAMATAYGISGHYWTSSEFFNGTNYEECKNNAWRFVTNSNFQGNMKSLNFNVRSIFAY